MTRALTASADRIRRDADRRAASGLRSRAALRAASRGLRSQLDVRGKVAVITGANSGIGFQAARQLAAAGATVVLACRHPGRMAEAARAIRSKHPDAIIDEVAIDLGSLRSVRAAASAIANRHPHVNILINNAGMIGEPGWRTLDGFETCFGVNHLGHFALTGLLLDRLLAAPEARIVTVSSTAHRVAHLNPQDWPNPRVNDIYRAYAASKLANLLFAYHLHRQITAAGVVMRSIACHPGWVATQLLSSKPRSARRRAGVAALRAIGAIVGQEPEDGARPLLLAAAADVPSGTYLGPTRWWRTRGPVGLEQSSADSQNASAARLLWDLSGELSGVEFAQLAAPAVAGHAVQQAEVRNLGELWAASNYWTTEPVSLILPDGAELTVRSATADDTAAVEQLHQRCSSRSRQQRYLGGSTPAPGRLRRLLDPPRGLTLLATAARAEPGQPVAMANLVAEGDEGEVGLLVRDDWQRRGVGTELLRRLLQYAEDAGYRALVIHTEAQNTPMLRTVARLNRSITIGRDGSIVRMILPLTDGTPRGR
ncbi:oxidoreductase [Micromonospora endolithica]|uniref:oxidoreductase n=1 Tax=Micromonospora endolithica TaxID=230091 RepID=UPI0011AC37B0|nr:oxidoreductase [Micromonospora endolithica]TWJ20904.1 NAD(P)-dependent dehydrogenase (short-subunit alcohol dehydrogenase family) [Micromonospora endolithica]